MQLRVIGFGVLQDGDVSGQDTSMGGCWVNVTFCLAQVV